MEERDYLYLKGNEELGDIIEILREFKGDEIILVVPNQTKALLHPVNIDLLKKEFLKNKKKIYFSTEDKKIGDLLKAAGFNVFLEEYETPEELSKIVTDIIVPAKSKPKVKKLSAKSEFKEKSALVKPKSFLVKWLKLVLLLILIAVIIGFGLDKFTSKAVITITLKSESKDFQEVIELRPGIVSNDLSNQILAGEKIELAKTHTIIVSATGVGRGGNRAKGEITVRNSSEYATPLVQGTRFQSQDGKIYRSTKRIYIPSQSEGGTVKVEVVADEMGEKYNINPAAEFTIPGFKGTAWDTRLKTTAESGIFGGGNSEIKIATIDDLTAGRVKFEKELKEIIFKEIGLKYKEYIFPEDGGSINIGLPDISHRVGQITDRIVFSGKGEFKIIGVKKDKLVNFVKDLIADKNLKEKVNVRIAELDIENFRIIDSDAKLSYARIQVAGKVKTKSDIDVKQVVEQLKGKRLEEIKDILKNNSAIGNAEGSIWPFWNNSLPLNSDKIEIKVR
jgi:hypothetical protein